MSALMTETVAPPTSTAELADRLARIRHRIDAHAASDRPVTVVGVTKAQPHAVVPMALDAGLVELGENYQQGLLAADASLGDRSVRPNWHFIGAVQRNKVRKLAPVVAVWETVDRLDLGAEIAQRAPGATVYVQVNTTGEAQKRGCQPDEVAGLVRSLGALALDVRGLMTIGVGGDIDGTRRAFRLLRTMVDDLGLPVCSMGMSGDFEVAVEEGSTSVRIGTALFGARSQPLHMRD